jgi:glycosyltransferase involved in cell wall biosynthesis
MFVITSMPVGGAETLLVNLVRRMDHDRFLPEICCLKAPGPLGEELAKEIPVHSHLLGCKYDVRVLRRLKELFAARRIDAVITVGAGDKMFWGRLAARWAGVPVILSAIHSTGWPDQINWLNRRLTRLTDAFIAVAQPHGEHLVEKEGFPRAKVRVIPNGVDVERFARGPIRARRCGKRSGFRETPRCAASWRRCGPKKTTSCSSAPPPLREKRFRKRGSSSSATVLGGATWSISPPS